MNPATPGSSPHARRSFFPARQFGICHDLFSARAEVIPCEVGTGLCYVHSSPHARRSFHAWARLLAHGDLFSARAEVIPAAASSSPATSPLLRTRGGHSKTFDLTGDTGLSSPHARRSFLQEDHHRRRLRLFSARAEVIRVGKYRAQYIYALLRTRGGHSHQKPRRKRHDHSSPHARRSFRPTWSPGTARRLFSARAEVIPRSSSVRILRMTLLRTRGGHSEGCAEIPLSPRSSPHARRSFQQTWRQRPSPGLFSARAEVIPRSDACLCGSDSLLRTRGGHSL